MGNNKGNININSFFSFKSTFVYTLLLHLLDFLLLNKRAVRIKYYSFFRKKEGRGSPFPIFSSARPAIYIEIHFRIPLAAIAMFWLLEESERPP